ncbi:hypothetical protein H2248_012228 [Termitomyces sp. 'cryptogamus']|nr:hypothetical protein H2248_012228 [Termitomyces sp. 'cryptogamus']
MGIEERRKQLMARGRKTIWGDRQTTHIAGTRDNSNTLCNCPAEFSVSAPIAQLNHITNVSLPFDTYRRLSTRGWTLEELLKQGKRFRPVSRVPLKSAKRTVINFEENGIPHIISGFHQDSNWPKERFNVNWLKNHGPKEISVRNVYDSTDKTMPLDDFIEQSRRIAPTFASLKEKERFYGEDLECPKEWVEWLRSSDTIPFFLLPGNDEDLLPHHVDSLKCHIGVGDTFTPCHKDLCASSTHNLMCYAEENGSSFWFMTEGRVAADASKYFEDLKQKMGHKDHVLTVQQLAKAPFVIYVAEQKLGDLVLVPPRSCHQIVNSAGLTIKTSWSRMTFKGLETAYYHELPMYRRVCWPEKYRIKSLIYLALLKRKEALVSLTRNHKRDQAVLTQQKDKKLISTTEQLLKLFGSVLLEESPPPERHLQCLQSNTPGSLNTSSAVTVQLTCDFCGADIFQSFFECLKCVLRRETSQSLAVKHGDGLVICPGCYIEGRSCKCGDMYPVQCRPFQELLTVRNQVADLLSRFKTTPIPKYEDTKFNFAMRTFRAACLLQDMRTKSKEEEKICSACTVGSVPAIVLNCKKCHRGRCFPHILALQNLHAADAILIHFSHSSHEAHNLSHGSSLQKHREGRDLFFHTQRLGFKPDPTQQRVHLVEQYRRCLPRKSAFVQAGWYDVQAMLMNTETEKTRAEISQDLAEGNRSPLQSSSPLTVLDSDSPLSIPLDLSDPTIQTTSGTVTSTLKRKRQILDFVAVPHQPHKIIMIQKPTSITTESDSTHHGEVISGVQSSGNGLSAPNSKVVYRGRDQDRETMQKRLCGPSISSVTRENRNSSQSPASGTIAPSLKSKNSILPATKKRRTVKHIGRVNDGHTPLMPHTPHSMSSTTSSQFLQRSQVPEAPAREIQSSSLSDTVTTSDVAGLAEAFNTAVISNHSALDAVDVDRPLDPTASRINIVSKGGEVVASTVDRTPLTSDGPSTSSSDVSGMVRERDQDVIQTDPPRLPPNRRCDWTPSRTLTSASPTPPEIEPRHLMPVNVEKNRTSIAHHVSKKRSFRIRSTTPDTNLSASSTSTRSSRATQFQARYVVSTEKDKKSSRRDGPFLIPTPVQSPCTNTSTGPRQASALGSDVKSRQLSPSRAISRERVLPEVSVTGSAEALDTQPTVSRTPSNTTVPNVALSTSTSGKPLEIAVQKLHKAIDESQHVPSPVVNAIVAVADAMNKFSTQHPQNSSAFSAPTWYQGNYPPMIQQPYSFSPVWWGHEYQRYQQPLSQYHEMFPYYTAPPLDEGYPNLRPPVHYDHHFNQQAASYDDGSRMRSGYSYGHRRHQPYRDDFERRMDNRSHSSTRPRYNPAQAQDRPMRSARHQAHSFNRYPDSRRWNTSSEGRNTYRHQHQFDPLVESAGTGSFSLPTSTLHNQGGSDENSVENLTGGIGLHQDRCSASPTTNQPQSTYTLDSHKPAASQLLVQQSDGVNYTQDTSQTSSHSLAESQLASGNNGQLLNDFANGKHDYGQGVLVNDDDLSQEELSKSVGLKQPPNSLYDNPWAC